MDLGTHEYDNVMYLSADLLKELADVVEYGFWTKFEINYDPVAEKFTVCASDTYDYDE